MYSALSAIISIEWGFPLGRWRRARFVIGGIFLNYRRDDEQTGARLVQVTLRDLIPDASVFMDQDSIQPGLNYPKVIREKVSSCAVLLAVIGPQWATLTDEKGRRRLDDPGDFVRSEIQTALECGIPVIPVLVDGALMPGPEQLPAGLQELAWLQAQELSSGRHYEDDADDLVKCIQGLLATASGTGIGQQSPPATTERTAQSSLIGGNNGLSGVGIGGSSSLSGASLQAGQALNAGTDALAAQVMQTELAAATEQAQYQELQIESDANNAAASSVAQAAQNKMQTNSKIFEGFDQVISG